jgi:hypothetical protein
MMKSGRHRSTQRKTALANALRTFQYFPYLLDIVVEGKYDPSFIFTHEGTQTRASFSFILLCTLIFAMTFKNLQLNFSIFQISLRISHRVTTHSLITKCLED